ncbi:MAG: tetratricopeptide repeat protein, partial [Rhodospirillaceae bacterium]|nr:tetratricopeptide repeat protein [Rhodospirillaceae bacterium]
MDEFDDMDGDETEREEQIAPSATIINALLQEADIARRRSDFDGAISAYLQVLDVDPEWVDALLGIAQCHHVLGRPRDALQTCITLLEMDPRHVGARLEMAEALRQIGRIDEAHAIHDLLLHERPDSPYTWCGLAHLLTDESHSEAAEACLRRALALSTTH